MAQNHIFMGNKQFTTHFTLFGSFSLISTSLAFISLHHVLFAAIEFYDRNPQKDNQMRTSKTVLFNMMLNIKCMCTWTRCNHNAHKLFNGSPKHKNTNNIRCKLRQIEATHDLDDVNNIKTTNTNTVFFSITNLSWNSRVKFPISLNEWTTELM